MSKVILPDEWLTTPLETLFTYVIGGDWGKDVSLNIEEYVNVACIRGAEFKNWYSDFGKTAVLRQIKKNSLLSRQLSYGDLLIEISGGGPTQPVGRTVCITRKTLDSFINTPIVCTNFIRLARPSKLINSIYLNYYLTLFYSSNKINDYQSGSNNLRNLKFKEYSQISIPFPSLAEQKVIADLLDQLIEQVDKLKLRLETILITLKQFRQSVLYAAVTGKLTEDWRKEQKIINNSWTYELAKDLCLKIQNGSTPKDSPFEKNGTIPFLKVYNIVNQEINFDYKPQFILENTHSQKLKKSITYPNDILMNIVGPPLGKIAIVTNQYSEWNINQAITLFRVNPKKIDHNFLYFVLCEGALVRNILHETKGIVGQVNISLTQCRNALIPKPSLQEQKEIVSRVESYFAFADKIEQQVKSAQERVKNLTPALLAKAFKGELTADWRAKHPELISGENSAEALLKRIQAEQEASTKPAKNKKVKI